MGHVSTDLEALQGTSKTGKGGFDVIPRSAMGFRKICLGDAWLNKPNTQYFKQKKNRV